MAAAAALVVAEAAVVARKAQVPRTPISDPNHPGRLWV